MILQVRSFSAGSLQHRRLIKFFFASKYLPIISTCLPTYLIFQAKNNIKSICTDL